MKSEDLDGTCFSLKRKERALPSSGEKKEKMAGKILMYKVCVQGCT